MRRDEVEELKRHIGVVADGLRAEAKRRRVDEAKER